MIFRAERMLGVHNDLIQVMFAAAQTVDFIITEGLRTKERQAILFEEGKSRTLNSRHITGHAVDIAIMKGDKLTWDIVDFKRIAAMVLHCAEGMKIPVVWGGSWKSFVDGPHFELKASKYP